MDKFNNIEGIVADIHYYFDKVEARFYHPAYLHDAKRKFTKYYVAHVADFYEVTNMGLK